MASFHAIAAAANAIKALIDERYPRDFGRLTNRVCQAKDVEAGLTGDGFGIFFWRVAINGQRRTRGPRTDVFGNRFKPSLPVDISCLIIPYTSGNLNAERLLRMLGWALRGLEDAGPLSSSFLNSFTSLSEPIFSDSEDIELVCEPLSQADQFTLWDRMKKHPLAVNYTLRMVLLDSNQLITEGAPVVERDFQLGALAQ